MFNIFRKKFIYFLFLLFVCNGVEYFCSIQKIEQPKQQDLAAEIKSLADRVNNTIKEWNQMWRDAQNNNDSDIARAVFLLGSLWQDSLESEESQKNLKNGYKDLAVSIGLELELQYKKRIKEAIRLGCSTYFGFDWKGGVLGIPDLSFSPESLLCVQINFGGRFICDIHDIQIKPGLACSYGTFDKDFSCGPSIEISFPYKKYRATKFCFSIKYDCLFGCGKRATIGGLFRRQEHVVSFGARFLFFGEKMFSLSLAVISSIRYRHCKTIKKVYDDLLAKLNDIQNKALDYKAYFGNCTKTWDDLRKGDNQNVDDFKNDCNACIDAYTSFKNLMHDEKILNVGNTLRDYYTKRYDIHKKQVEAWSKRLSF